MNQPLSRLPALALIALFALPSSSQQPKTPSVPQPVDYEMVTRIRQEAFRRSQVMDNAWELTEHIGPRLTNSPNQRRAADWAKARLAAFGLENARSEKWGIFGPGWSYERATARMTKPEVAQLLVLPKAWSLGTNGAFRGRPVLANIKKKEDFEKYRGKLAGAILFNGEVRELKVRDKAESTRLDEKELAKLFDYEIPGPRNKQRAEAIERAKRYAFMRDFNRFLEQEKAAILVEPGRAPFDGGVIAVQGNGQAYKKDEPKGVPVVVMAPEHWNRVARLLNKKQEVEVEFDIATTLHDYNGDHSASNVFAELPGSDLKDEVVMIGAHLDSWHGATGATDNAAGVSVMMEAMRILKAVGAKPLRTIRIALWTGEEQGLLGSRAYVAEHLAVRPLDPADKDLSEYQRRQIGPLQPKPEHAKISVYFNMDSGTGKIRGIYTQENAALAPIFQQWMEPFRDVGMNTVVMENAGGSDFLSFDSVGVPGIDFLHDDIEYLARTWHTNVDFYDRLQREDLMQASAIVASFAYHASMRDQVLPRKPLPQPEPPFEDVAVEEEKK